jgi:hypothetical protein
MDIPWADEEDDMVSMTVVGRWLVARWTNPLASAPSWSVLVARVCGGTVGTVNVGSRAPTCPPFIVALRERGPTAIHGKHPRSGRGSDRFPNPEITFVTLLTFMYIIVIIQTLWSSMWWAIPGPTPTTPSRWYWTTCTTGDGNNRDTTNTPTRAVLVPSSSVSSMGAPSHGPVVLPRGYVHTQKQHSKIHRDCRSD